eukprot:CAMPEP_0170245658 /NCGR_PEP_ID=MMETSP0116_2-20130129/22614_1 /TAXON_ID=400756 /ORGANISM="Durinskia baltica, Strain CSIRO CS-38" /LENGTH=243 /DNA_ID=CAMNT_0010496531 /DNA_START=311 /DNA_END=1041 /DNA_ORIENTATION=-
MAPEGRQMLCLKDDVACLAHPTHGLVRQRVGAGRRPRRQAQSDLAALTRGRTCRASAAAALGAGPVAAIAAGLGQALEARALAAGTPLARERSPGGLGGFASAARALELCLPRCACRSAHARALAHEGVAVGVVPRRAGARGAAGLRGCIRRAFVDLLVHLAVLRRRLAGAAREAQLPADLGGQGRARELRPRVDVVEVAMAPQEPACIRQAAIAPDKAAGFELVLTPRLRRGRAGRSYNGLS